MIKCPNIQPQVSLNPPYKVRTATAQVLSLVAQNRRHGWSAKWLHHQRRSMFFPTCKKQLPWKPKRCWSRKRSSSWSMVSKAAIKSRKHMTETLPSCSHQKIVVGLNERRLSTVETSVCWLVDRHGVGSREVETVLFSQISWIEVVNLTLVWN